MPRGDTLGQMLNDLRAEAGYASTPALSVNQRPKFIRLLQRVQRRLWTENTWLHRRVFADKLVAAGQRYYDFPTTINAEKVIEVKYKWSDQWLPVTKGIDPSLYSAFDSDNDARSDPLQRWDIVFTGTREQVEVWPIPTFNGVANGSGTLRFRGVQVLTPLVADGDPCVVDSDLIVLFAAAEELAAKESPDAPAKLQAAKDMLRNMKGDLTGRQASNMGSGVNNTRPARHKSRILVGTGNGI